MCHRKEAERQNILRRIQAAGCPIEVDLPRVDTRNELSIMQAGEAYLFDLGTAGSALALWMRLSRGLSGKISIVEFGDVFVSWGPMSTTWLDPLQESGPPIYRLPNGFDFPCDSVLNDRFGRSGLTVRSGQFLEGYALGSTKMQVPERFIHGSLLEGEFSVLDGMGREFRGEVQFLVDRLTQPIRRGRSVPRREGCTRRMSGLHNGTPRCGPQTLARKMGSQLLSPYVFGRGRNDDAPR